MNVGGGMEDDFGDFGDFGIMEEEQFSSDINGLNSGKSVYKRML